MLPYVCEGLMTDLISRVLVNFNSRIILNIFCFLQESLSKVVCGDFLTAVESVVGKEPNKPAEPWTPSWTDRFFEHIRDAGNYNTFSMSV